MQVIVTSADIIEGEINRRVSDVIEAGLVTAYIIEAGLVTS